MLKSFLGCVGKTMEGSGLEEVIGIMYGSNTAQHIMSRGAFAKAIRFNILLDAAFVYVILKDMMSDFTGAISIESFKDSINDIKREFMNKLEELSETSRTARLWVQFHKMVTIVKNFIRAEREHDWELHIATVSAMLTYFAACGHGHYAKASRIYLQTMVDLRDDHPHIWSCCIRGAHTIRYSEKNWCAVWSDLAIEQTLMRAAKSQGGLSMGRLRDPFTGLAHLRWVLTLSHFASINHALASHQQALVKPHRDCSEKLMSKDFEILHKLINWLKEHNSLEPVENPGMIISLSTGLMTLSADVNADNAHEIGLEIQTGLDGKVMTDTIPTKNLKPLSNLQKRRK